MVVPRRVAARRGFFFLAITGVSSLVLLQRAVCLIVSTMSSSSSISGALSTGAFVKASSAKTSLLTRPLSRGIATGVGAVGTPAVFDYSYYAPGESFSDWLSTHGNPLEDPFRYIAAVAGASGGGVGLNQAFAPGRGIANRMKWGALPVVTVPAERALITGSSYLTQLDRAAREGSLWGDLGDRARDWLPLIGAGGIGLGALGLGAYAYNQHRNRELERELEEQRKQEESDKLTVQVPGRRLSEKFYRTMSRDLLFNNEDLDQIYDV